MGCGWKNWHPRIRPTWKNGNVPWKRAWDLELECGPMMIGWHDGKAGELHKLPSKLRKTWELEKDLGNVYLWWDSVLLEKLDFVLFACFRKGVVGSIFHLCFLLDFLRKQECKRCWKSLFWSSEHLSRSWDSRTPRPVIWDRPHCIPCGGVKRTETRRP